MSTQSFPSLQPKVVLGIAAHADDLDFGASGTMARFAAYGAEVHYLILTDGSKGSSDTSISSSDLIKIREEEQRDALEGLGGKREHVYFGGYPDGGLEVTLDLKKEIVKHIRTIKPDTVVTLDPAILYNAERGFINHPDHRAAGQAALDAVYPLARDHLTYPDLYAEGYQPHKVAHVLLTSFGGAGNYSVDITDTMDKKMAALAAHPSQMQNLQETQAWMKDIAAQAGKANGFTYAENFTRIDIR